MQKIRLRKIKESVEYFIRNKCCRTKYNDIDEYNAVFVEKLDDALE